MALSELPHELLLYIARNLERDRDISALARSCHKLYVCLDRYLYIHDLENYEGKGFRRAVACGNEASVQKFLDAGVDIIAYEMYEGELLSIAISEKHTKVLAVLLAVNIDEEYRMPRAISALKNAAASHNEAAVRLVLSKDVKSRLGPDFGYSPSVVHEAMLKTMTDAYPQRYGELRNSEDAVEHELDHEIEMTRMEDKPDYAPENGAARETIAMMLLGDNTENIHILEMAESLLSAAVKCGFSRVAKGLVDRKCLGVSCRPSRRPLIAAARQGHKAIVKMLIETGYFPRDSSWHGDENLIRQAAASGNAEVVKLVLDEYSCDVRLRKEDIHAAAEYARSGEVLAFLREEGLKLDADYAFRLLYQAALYGRHNVVKFLLEETPVDPARRDPAQDQTALAAAAIMGRAATVKVLLEHTSDPNTRFQRGQTVLSLAAGAILIPKDELIETVDVLLSDCRVDPEARDNDDRTALLHAAVEPTQWRVAERLLKDHRINPDARDGIGRTPLSYAAQRCAAHCYNPTVRLLLSDPRVDPNSRDNTGRTPVSWATQGNYPWASLCYLVQDSRIDPDLPDNRGRTPLSFGAGLGRWQSESAVKLLLEDPRVNPDSQDRDGQTPLSWAAKSGTSEKFASLLRR